VRLIGDDDVEQSTATAMKDSTSVWPAPLGIDWRRHRMSVSSHTDVREQPRQHPRRIVEHSTLIAATQTVNSVSHESPKLLTTPRRYLCHIVSRSVLLNSTAVNQPTRLIRQYYCRIDSITTDWSLLYQALQSNNTGTSLSRLQPRPRDSSRPYR